MTNLATAITALSRNYGRRTRATEKVVSAVHSIAGAIIESSEPGDKVRVHGATYEVAESRSNIGSIRSLYLIGYDEEYGFSNNLDMMECPGSSGYNHGDFNCPYHAPDADAFVEFANHSAEIVAAFATLNAAKAANAETATVAASATI